MDDCRKSFEEWGKISRPFELWSEETILAWTAWQAAWNRRTAQVVSREVIEDAFRENYQAGNRDDLGLDAIYAIQLPAPVAEVPSVAEISPNILKFAVLMNEKLVKNRYKGGWEDCSPEWLVERMGQELTEVIEAIKLRKEPREVALECADVANFAMMVAEVVTDALLVERQGKQN